MRRSWVALALVLVGARAAADESSAPYAVSDTTSARVALESARTAFSEGEIARGSAELQRILDTLRDDLIVAPEPDAPPADGHVPTRYVSAPTAAIA